MTHQPSKTTPCINIKAYTFFVSGLQIILSLPNHIVFTDALQILYILFSAKLLQGNFDIFDAFRLDRQNYPVINFKSITVFTGAW